MNKNKKIDDLERIRLIKEWLPDMVSANIELVINMAVRQLRYSSVLEFQNMIRKGYVKVKKINGQDYYSITKAGEEHLKEVLKH